MGKNKWPTRKAEVRITAVLKTFMVSRIQKVNFGIFIRMFLWRLLILKMIQMREIEISWPIMSDSFGKVISLRKGALIFPLNCASCTTI